MLEAVRQNGDVLQYASEALRDIGESAGVMSSDMSATGSAAQLVTLLTQTTMGGGVAVEWGRGGGRAGPGWGDSGF